MAEAVVVGVRVRPFNDREKNLNATVCIDMNGPTTSIRDANGEAKDFAFDESFWSHDGFKDNGSGYMEPEPGSKYADQRFVFDTFGKRVLDNAWAGFHCCLFAYGQTGAGKSYSMVGYGNNKGIVPISCEEIFKRIDLETDPNRRYEVTVSMVEIYNETVQDLLIEPEARPKKGLEIRESKLLGIYIDGVIKRPVKDYAAIEATIEEATNHRTVGSTLMNATSSRAHTVQSIEFKQVEKIGATEQVKISMINLVDLAGSEKAGQTGASGDRLKEGAMINKSLSALGNVIEKLAEKSSGKGAKNLVVPYRDSKLTRLLQNALGGSSKTIMICALSPASSNYEETLSTLRYADRAKKIKNTATVNENPLDKLLRELKQENQALKDMMAKMQSGEGMDTKALTEVTEKQKEIEDAEKAMAEMTKSFEQREKEDKELQEKTEKRKRSMPAAALVPMLVNLNADPMLTGRTKYFLNENSISSIGSNSKKNMYDDHDSESESDSDEDKEEEDEEREPDVLLMHESIFYNHATINNDSGQCYLKATSESETMTFVNGKSLSMLHRLEKETDDDAEKEEEAPSLADWPGVLLNHGDRVVFGECYFFFADPSGGMAPEIMIASGQVDFAMAQNELHGAVGDSPWGKTPKQIVSVVRRLKVFAPLVKILDDVRAEHEHCEEEKTKFTMLKMRKSALDTRLAQEHEQLVKLQEEKAALDQVKEEKEKLEQAMADEREARAKLEEKIAALQSEKDASDAKLKAAYEEVETLKRESEASVSKEEHEALKAEKENLTRERESLVSKEEHEALKAEKESLTRERETLVSKEEHEALKAEKETLTRERETLVSKEEHEALKAEKESLTRERESLISKEEHEALKAEKENLTRERASLVSKEEHEALKAEKDSLTHERESLVSKEEHEALKAEKDHLASKLEAELAQLREEAEQAGSQAAKLQQELESTQDKLVQAEKELKENPNGGPAPEPSMGVSFDQAIEALDLVERTLRELETKKKAGGASEEYPMF